MRNKYWVELHSPLQVLSCLLQEQRLVLFSSDWARLTLVAESLLLYLQVSVRGTSFKYRIIKLSPELPFLSFSLSLCAGSSPMFLSCPEECWTSSWRPLPSWWAVTSVTLRRLLPWVYQLLLSMFRLFSSFFLADLIFFTQDSKISN